LKAILTVICLGFLKFRFQTLKNNSLTSNSVSEDIEEYDSFTIVYGSPDAVKVVTTEHTYLFPNTFNGTTLGKVREQYRALVAPNTR